MSLTVKGHREMQRKLREIARRHPDKIKAATRAEAESIMADSKANYVPVDLGTLRASGYVGEPVIKGSTVSLVLGYGGAAEPYALAVHETPSKHDPPSWQGVDVQFRPAGRGPKYLERPLKAAVPGMAARIAEKLDPGKDTAAAAGLGSTAPAGVGQRTPRSRDSRGRFTRGGA